MLTLGPTYTTSKRLEAYGCRDNAGMRQNHQSQKERGGESRE